MLLPLIGAPQSIVRGCEALRMLTLELVAASWKGLVLTPPIFLFCHICVF